MLDAVIVVEKPREIEIGKGENRIERAVLIALKGGFSTTDHSYKFEIKSDGTGEIFTYVQSFEGAGFNAYRRASGKWTQSFETSNYHCAF